MTNQPDPAPPESSTEDLGDPSQGMEGMDQGNGISLTSDQAKMAGIHEPQPGDEYTLTIKVGDTSQGISATILDGSAKKADAAPNDMDDTGQTDADAAEDPDPDAADAVQDDAENPEESAPPLAVKPAKKFKMKILGPKEMGMDKEEK